MAWVKKICEKYQSSLPCDKTCCDVKFRKKFNALKFWGLVAEEIRDDCYYSAPNKLVFEKTIYLNEREKTVLRLGLNPENEFRVTARLLRSDSAAFGLRMVDVENLLQYLDANEMSITTSCTFQNSSKLSKEKVKIEVQKARVINLNLSGRVFNCDENTLKTLCLSRNHIRRVITDLKKRSETCIGTFFVLLHHYTFGGTYQSVCEVANSNLTQKFFDQMIDFHGGCADRKIIGEIGMNFTQFFEKCVPLFIRCKMFFESERLKSFNTWPHPKEHISIEILAKAGQFYSGHSDMVMCAFCHLKQSQWQSDDHPILEHYKHFKNCRFIRDHVISLNVPDVGTTKELEELFSVLPNLDVDEVDSA